MSEDLKLVEVEMIPSCFDGITTEKYKYDAVVSAGVAGIVRISVQRDNSENKLLSVNIYKSLSYSPSHKADVEIKALEKKIEFLEKEIST